MINNREKHPSELDCFKLISIFITQLYFGVYIPKESQMNQGLYGHLVQNDSLFHRCSCEKREWGRTNM
jgi:hypothetical protein